MHYRVLLVTAAALSVAAGPASAGVDILQPVGGPVVKTSPLEASDFVSAPIEIHFANSHTNWSGVGFAINFDSHEVNFVGFNPVPGWTLTDRGSFSPSTSGSSPGYLLATLWHPNAVNSGVPTGPSQTLPLGSITYHVHRSTGENSDIDIHFGDYAGNTVPSPFNIFHATSASIQLSFGPSDLLYVPKATPTPGAWQPVSPGAGTWIHLTASTTLAQQMSAFYGKFSTLAGIGGIGVEHVPEPTSGALLLGGLALLVAARRLGGRRI